MHYNVHKVHKTLICFALAFSPFTCANADEPPANRNLSIDERLIEQLSFDEETLSRVQSEMGSRPTPSEIRALRHQMSLEEGARQNPVAPSINNRVITIDRGQSPTLDIMQRFDTTLVFADRAGNPLKLRHWRISDSTSAELIPLHDNLVHSAPAGPDNSQPDRAQSEGDDFAIYTEPEQPQRSTSTGSGESRGPVNALIISPRAAMRSTNITVRVEGEDYPIVLTVRSHPSTETERELAYINEIRLDWKVNMPDSVRMAGKYRMGEALDTNMVSLLQGIPGPELTAVPLNGEISNQLSLWKDATERNHPTYYLRMADHLSVWNVSIDDQSHDRMRGFKVIKLNGAPPKSMGFTNNGQEVSVTLAN